MAIYHLSAQIIGRSEGRSSVAAAAYRAKEKILDERTGLAHDYTKRKIEIESEILAPSNSPEWVYERQKLWNEVESIEKRKDAQLAREINVALPRELSQEKNRELIKEYAHENFVSKGMIADISIHWDKDNPHAHIMLTTREINQKGFDKKNREWNDKNVLESWRESWSRNVNRSLSQENIQERVSHKTLKEQGIDREPQIHLGHAVIAMERKGIKTERFSVYKDIEDVNRKIIEIEEYKWQKEELIRAEKTLGLDYELTEDERNQVKVVRDSISEDEFSRDTVLNEIQKVEKTETNKQKDLREVEVNLREQNNLKAQIEKLKEIEGNINKCSLGYKILHLKEYREFKEKAKSQRDYIQRLCESKKIPSLESVTEIITKTKNEKTSLESELENIERRKIEIKKTVEIMENAEKRHILKNYPKEIQGMDYKGAIKLKAYNLRQGRIVDYKDIYKHCEEIEKKYSELERYIRNIQAKDRDIKNAEGILESYLNDKKDLEKLEKAIFKFGKKYNEKLTEAKIRVQDSESRYEFYQDKIGEVFLNQKEFKEIKNKHQFEIQKIPEAEKKLENMKFSLDFMNGLVSDIKMSITYKSVDYGLKLEQQKTRESSHTHERSRSREWDLER